MRIVDLRSDTVTKPTQAMREAMKNAVVGDDVMGEDPTVVALEIRVAQMFAKESALFFPSGTMSNLTALLSWCSSRGSEFIVGDQSHIFLFEQSGAAQFGGISPRTVRNLPDGSMDLSEVRNAIRDDDIHEPRTGLICIENTHNACGGKVLPLSFLEKLRDLGRRHRIPIHLDGARIWNALTSSQQKPSEISKFVDSLTVCLSKGLGAPVGSLLVGSTVFIRKARRIRKALGGGMRQSGILAAAGLIALDDFESGILLNDHKRAIQLAKSIESMKSFELLTQVETNILFIKIVFHNNMHLNTETGTISSHVSCILKGKGVLVSAWSPELLRIVIHRDINNEDVEFMIQRLQDVSNYLENSSNHSV